MSMLRFHGRVVVVTGGAGGLGKAYSLLFAERGAKVVVNDLGGGPAGEGSSSRPADVLVQEIRSKGGIAVADYHSVEEGTKIIQTAIDNFGRIDILVNNAGILRDKSFVNVTDADWDLVHKVHLRGSFMVTRAAWPYMRKQNYGKVIMTTSTAGIYGNFGQANYSAAKLGLLGLSNTLAIEGQKYNICCNTVAPMGGTRLTEGILPPDLFDGLKPELVAPLVLWLCHEDCQETGSLLEAGGGWFGKYRWERARGKICRSTLAENVTPEAIRDGWEEITDFRDSLHPTSNAEAAGSLAQVLQHLQRRSANVSPHKLAATMKNTSSGPMSALGAQRENITFTYDSKDVILYALGVGVSTKDDNGLKFLYEGHDEFCALPSFLIMASQEALMGSSLLFNLPGWTIDPTKLLHGEQYFELKKPLPWSGTLVSKVVISDVLDKGSGAVIVADVETADTAGELVARSQWSVFIVGDGNFGGPRRSTSSVPLADPPECPPDAIDSFKTSVDQAALYRLSGDRNPLHIDPSFAQLGGFEEPILHGLASYGVAARAVLKFFCGNDPTRFKAMKARFVKPVIPGQTLVTEMWRRGSRVFFQTSVKETGKVCLSGGYVDIVCSSADEEVQPGALLENILKDHLFENLSDRIQRSHAVQNMRASVAWKILRRGTAVDQWYISGNGHPVVLHVGDLPAADSVIYIELEDMQKVVQGIDSFQNLQKLKNVRIEGNNNLANSVICGMEKASLRHQSNHWQGMAGDMLSSSITNVTEL